MNSLSILVSWEIPSITNGIITYYDIRYKQLNSLGDFKYIRKIMQTHHRITRLKEATKYLLEVRANTAIGPGNWSGIEVVLVPGEITYLFPPIYACTDRVNCIMQLHNLVQCD